MALDNQSSDSGRRYQTLPSSAVVRSSPARRARVTIPSNSPYVCEESVHYPVFNPLDPRHNPTAPASSWLDDDCPPEAPVDPDSEGWMQSFSRRSMRKARSGFLALRSGMQRRPLMIVPRGNGEMPRSTPRPENHSDQKENMFPSTVSEASTEEDNEFGSHLHRTKCKSSPLTLGQDRPIPRSRFSTALADLSSFARRSEDATDSPDPVLTELVSNARVLESASENAEKSEESDVPSMNREVETGDYSSAISGTESSTKNSRPSNLPKTSAFSELADATAADTASLAHTSSSVDDSEISRVGKSAASSRCVAQPALGKNSSESNSTPSHDTKKFLRREDVVVPARPQESSVVELNDFDLMMDTLGAFDRLSTQDSPTKSLVEPQSNESSPGSPRRIDTGPMPPPRSSSTEREPRRSNGEAQPNGSCNIRIQVQSGDWSRSLSPVPESADLVDSNDFFGDQAAWSTRPSEEGTITDITSVSNALWSPVETEDMTSVVSLGDEYFLVDGKTSGFHPDRGDNPTKAERRLVSDGSLYSDPSLERNPSVRTQDIPEVIGPSSPMHRPPSGPRRRDRDASDSTDEYLLTYPVILRRYLS
ncbi:uncharacterized protein LDX57_009831 [Aspergillus melleus]|uniref:uncharacterized protein n=1 Tax=Aspergillus melleus TaxID=138277 RepID=UPI001E8E50D2|nr:uncharacterized protein LDX57_009831 [Aspergillus melleus]KAH8432192.1 hypothetical protein LDX57_009831 [Aspergillus melleus]